jgi:hypothetical protein
MRAPRATIAHMMIAIAVVAALAGLAQRRAVLKGKAAYHERAALKYICLSELAGHCGTGSVDEASVLWSPENGVELIASPTMRRASEETEVQRGRLSRISRYHALMAKKYRSAAAHPWLRVAPDPPEPR